ncbi:hypothetical protein BH20VER2_BH20VER2_00560 [soil metagenome]|nr:hypothetical protein [Chthoniobacterales bacterium]
MQTPRERRRVWWAVLGSLVVHVLAALSLAAFHDAFVPTPTVPDDRPMELTMLDLSTMPTLPTTPPNPAYIETDPSKQIAEEPETKTFESHANARAASDLPATGDLPLPTQKGTERPSLDLETQQSSVAMEGSQAQPLIAPAPTPPPVTPTPAPIAKATPQPTPQATPPPLPEPLATPEPDKFAMLTSTPPPALRDPEDAEETPSPDMPPTPPPVISRPRPESPATAYQREKQETAISGRITNRGAASVDAVATPLGKYRKQVSDAIGQRWYYHIKSRGDIASVGTAKVEAELDPSGNVVNLRVTSNSSNEAFANICLQSFQEAQIPPIPPDLVATLPGGKLPLDFSFTFF